MRILGGRCKIDVVRVGKIKTGVIMKKIALLTLMMIGGLSVGCGTKVVANADYPKNGQLPLNFKKPLVLKAYDTQFKGDGTFHDARFIADHMQLGLNLGNTMEAYNAGGCEKVTFTWIPVQGKTTESYETCWGAPVTNQMIIDGMKNAGFNTVRIPVFWGNMMENDGQWKINTEYLERVREIVDYCFNDDLYVVLNIHHFDEFIIRRYSLEDCEKIIGHLWTQIASYFEKYSEKLVFEGFNEYLGGDQFNDAGKLESLSRAEAFALTNALNQTFVDAVRSTGGNNKERVLIVSGYWTNIDLTSSSDYVVPEDSATDKLMVSVHYVDNTPYWQNKIGGQEWVDYIEDQCKKLEKAFTSRNIPVFMGETTSIYPQRNFSHAKLPEYSTSSECLKYTLNRLLDYGFVPVIWDTEHSNNFYSRQLKKIRNKDDAAVIEEVLERF